MNFTEILDHVSSFIFGLICHQHTSILAEAGGQHIMLCPRCSGLHIGFFVCIVLALAFFKGRKITGSQLLKIFCVSAIALLSVEWFLAQQNIIQSTTESRFITGLLAGCAFGLITLWYRSYYLYSYSQKTKNITLVALILTTLFLGLSFSRLSNWGTITFLLLMMVVLNLGFIVHSIFQRVYLVFANN